MSSTRRPPPTARGAAIRREPRVPATARWADALVALAATALTMAALVLAAALAGENVAGDEAGRLWALTFAGGLGLSGLFLALLGLALLGEGARAGGRYPLPLAIGAATGALTGALLLDGASREAVIASLLPLLLATPPARGALARMRRGGRGAGRRGR